MPKRKNPNDSTFRNNRATRKAIALLRKRVAELEAAIKCMKKCMKKMCKRIG